MRSKLSVIIKLVILAVAEILLSKYLTTIGNESNWYIFICGLVWCVIGFTILYLFFNNFRTRKKND